MYLLQGQAIVAPRPNFSAMRLILAWAMAISRVGGRLQLFFAVEEGGSLSPLLCREGENK
jgi:hypothetical protein